VNRELLSPAWYCELAIWSAAALPPPFSETRATLSMARLNRREFQASRKNRRNENARRRRKFCERLREGLRLKCVGY